MGAAASNQCRCCENQNEEMATVTPIAPAASHWDEESVEETKRQQKQQKQQKRAPEVAAPLPPPPEPAAPPTKAVATAPAAAMPAAPVTSRSRKLVFELEAGKALGVRFLDSKTEDSGNIVIVSTVAENSVLRVTPKGEMGLVPGDVVTHVNGQGGKVNLITTMQEALAKGGKLELVVVGRPSSFQVLLEKKESKDFKMGVVVAVHDDVADRLEVRHVCDEGAICHWNVKNPFNYVCNGDWVTAVSAEDSKVGKPVNSQAMVLEMQKVWGEGKNLCLEVEPCNAKMPKSQ